MDLSLLNNAVVDTWGETLYLVKAGVKRKIDGVFVNAVAKNDAGNRDIERPDPSFEFRASDYQDNQGAVNDQVLMGNVTYTIISDPEFQTGDWCRVAVSQY
jgi:hypothetical protein